MDTIDWVVSAMGVGFIVYLVWSEVKRNNDRWGGK